MSTDLSAAARDARFAELASVIDAMMIPGYRFDPRQSTGGNCEAMWITAPDESALGITDGDAALPFSSDEPDYQGLTFVYYDADFCDVGWTELDEYSADRVRELVQRWIDGSPIITDES